MLFRSKRTIRRWGLDPEVHGQVANFMDIYQLKKSEDGRVAKMANHIKSWYMLQKNFTSMKVKPAVAILSRKTGAALETAHQLQPNLFTKEVLVTAKFCKNIYKWYRIAYNRKEDANCFKKNSNANNERLRHELRRFAIDMGNMKILRERNFAVQWKKGIHQISKTIIDISILLIEGGIMESFHTSKLSTDFVESYHSTIREMNRNVDPLQLQSLLKHVVFNQWFKNSVRGQNCPAEKTDPLCHDIMQKTFQRLIKRKPVIINDPQDCWSFDRRQEKEIEAAMREEAVKAGHFDFKLLQNMQDLIGKDMDISDLHTFEQSGLVAFYGYLLHVFEKKKSLCIKCRAHFIMMRYQVVCTTDPIYNLLKNLEYKNGHLTFPTSRAIAFFNLAEDHFLRNR